MALLVVALIGLSACGDDGDTAATDGITLSASDTVWPDTGNARGDAGTLTVGVDLASGDASDASLLRVGPDPHGNRLEMVKNGHFLRLIVADESGLESDVSVPISHWVAGERHEVTVTWGSGRVSVFLDGALMGETTSEPAIQPGVPLFIGWDSGSDSPVEVRDAVVYGVQLGDDA